MANYLKMAEVHAIQTLRAQGWSFRRIGRELGVHRETVARYVYLAESAADGAFCSKPANLPAGSTGSSPR